MRKSTENNLNDILGELKTPKSQLTPNESSNFALPVASFNQDDQTKAPVSSISLPSKVHATRFRDRLRENRLVSAKQLEATEIMLDTQIEKLGHQAEAAKRESKAFCDAKSVEVAENIKTYFQAKIRTLENERLMSRNESINEAYTRTAQKMEEVLNGPLPDQLKTEVIERLSKNLEKTVEHLENNTIAARHGLT